MQLHIEWIWRVVAAVVALAGIGLVIAAPASGGTARLCVKSEARAGLALRAPLLAETSVALGVPLSVAVAPCPRP